MLNQQQVFQNDLERHCYGRKRVWLKKTGIRSHLQKPNLRERLRWNIWGGKFQDFNYSPSTIKNIFKIQVAIINAWIKFSASCFCCRVPVIRATRSPREDLDSEISIIAPDIWKRTRKCENAIQSSRFLKYCGGKTWQCWLYVMSTVRTNRPVMLY